MGETEFVIEPGRQDIVITRVFDAPREVVFKALTDPNLIPNWWGPARYETTVDRADVRPGGQWRYVSRDADGTEYGFRGSITTSWHPTGSSRPSSSRGCRGTCHSRRPPSRRSTGRPGT